MLNDLFVNNKLEYIYIFAYNSKDIVKSMTISTSIENLRYLYIENYDRVDITLDISQKYPTKL